jgi:hypothetical protein
VAHELSSGALVGVYIEDLTSTRNSTFTSCSGKEKKKKKRKNTYIYRRPDVDEELATCVLQRGRGFGRHHPPAFAPCFFFKYFMTDLGLKRLAASSVV